jgi:hypothetical protein
MDDGRIRKIIHIDMDAFYASVERSGRRCSAVRVSRWCPNHGKERCARLSSARLAAAAVIGAVTSASQRRKKVRLEKRYVPRSGGLDGDEIRRSASSAGASRRSPTADFASAGIEELQRR